MNLDKKSLIQIVILVVLVVGGAGAYLMQQNGGLDSIMSLLPGESASTQAPASKGPTTAHKKLGATSGTRVRAGIPEIPATPAKGEIHGMPFVVESSSIENGVLTLRFGKDVTADLEVKVMLSTPPWQVPAGKNFKVNGQAGGGVSQIVLAWKEKGQTAPSEQKFTDKYILALDFGQEQDKKLPGKIYLHFPDEVKTSVAGTFDADIRGFRIIDGKPDLAADSVDTLQYLALRDMLKDDPSKTMDVVAFRDGRYSPPESAGKGMNGYIEVEYRQGQGPLTVERFQFEKDAGAWKVARTLKVDQLDEAHPLQVPDSKSPPTKLMTYLAARRLEADIRKKDPKKGIYEPGFTTRHSDKFKIGVCEVTYKLDPDGETRKAVYLFRNHGRGWTLDRELSKTEKVDFDTGRISRH